MLVLKAELVCVGWAGVAASVCWNDGGFSEGWILESMATRWESGARCFYSGPVRNVEEMGALTFGRILGVGRRKPGCCWGRQCWAFIGTRGCSE